MARALLRWTQRDLARKAGVARRTISDFESGLRPLRVRTRRDITNTFVSAGVSFDATGGIRTADTAPVREGSMMRAPAPVPMWPQRRGGP